MSTRLPLYRQKKRNTCALACLRMVLAAFGTDVEENILESQARMEPGGTDIVELERLARQFGLIAEIQDATVEQIGRFLLEDKFSIAYIDRAVFDLTPGQRAQHSLQSAKIHTVVPAHITPARISYHDPLRSEVARKAPHLFRFAYERLGSRSLICSK